MNKRIVCCCLLIALTGLSFPFSGEEKVMNEILHTLQRIPQDIHNTSPANLVKFRYSVQAVQASGERAVETSIFYKRGNRICLKSGKAICFQDPQNIFLILPEEKTIIRHRRQLSEEDKEASRQANLMKFESMLRFQEILMSRASVAGITEVEEAGRRLTKVTFVPDHTVEELRQISQVQVWYDRKNREIRRIWSHYAPGFRFSEMLITYEELTYNSGDKELIKEISDYVINKKNQPAGPYTGYRLIEE